MTQYMVHCFYREAIVFRGTEEECLKFINENDGKDKYELELYWANPGDKYYREEEEQEDDRI